VKKRRSISSIMSLSDGREKQKNEERKGGKERISRRRAYFLPSRSGRAVTPGGRGRPSLESGGGGGAVKEKGSLDVSLPLEGENLP